MVRRHILGSIVQSEGSYVDSLKRVLQVRLQGLQEPLEGRVTRSVWGLWAVFKGRHQKPVFLWGQQDLRMRDTANFRCLSARDDWVF